MRDKASILAEQARRRAAAAIPQEILAEIGGRGGGGAIAGAATFLLIAVGDDVLYCQEWDGSYDGGFVATGTGGYVYVARPWLLRNGLTTRSWTVNGVTYYPSGSQSRTATVGDLAETQLIVPPYTVAAPGSYPGDMIVAVRPTRGTGILDPGGNPVVWLDANVDGRQWLGVCTS